MRIQLISALGAGIIASLVSAVTLAAEPQSTAFFRNLAETRDYTLGQPMAAKFTPDGKTVLFLRGGARDPVLRLYAFDIATGQERELITPEQVLGSAEETLSPEEKARRERARISTRGFTTYELSKDGARLIVSLSGKLYLLTMADLRAVELPGQRWIDPRLSPNGKFLAAVSNNELHVIDLDALTAKAMTSGATETLHNGVAEFVAQEEMGRREGYWWSPDSTQLVYQQNDESGVEVRYIADPLRPEAKPQAFFYPRAGSANTKVRLGVIARGGGETQWISWDTEAYPYLARVVWDDNAPLTLLVQNRAQQKQMLLTANPATGKTRALLTETDKAWLNLDFVRTPIWLKDGKSFIWTTERKGAWQVEWRKANGALERFVTPRDFGYKRLVAVDHAKKQIYVQGGPDPRETHLWRFSMSSGKNERLTTAPGSHSAVFSEDRSTYVHSFHLRDGRLGAEIVRNGAVVATLPAVTETPPFLPNLEVTRAAGKYAFDAALIRPRDFTAGQKYPVILSVYAGPTAKRVTASLRSYFLDQWMADQGYIVVRLDNRGTPGYGRAWERIIRGNFIDIALQDQIDGLQALGTAYPELDLGRVGVTGWSFGGYFAAMAAMRRPDVFKAGVAGAPVVTWENYDTHYTERYLGLPQEAPDAYRISNVTTYVSELQRPLLLIHGLTDDNVYAQHTLQLIDALFRAGKPYEFMPMLGTHMISDPVIRQNQQERIMEFFERTVKVAS